MENLLLELNLKHINQGIGIGEHKFNIEKNNINSSTSFNKSVGRKY